MTGIVLMK